MSQEYLDFELPIAELEAKIESLRAVAGKTAKSILMMKSLAYRKKAKN
ncbi:Hypothetical Acetyl-coenzyme A carboxylase carboxyl transferase subunit alpha (fragment) [Avibacterium paragallinarum JF4211]